MYYDGNLQLITNEQNIIYINLYLRNILNLFNGEQENEFISKTLRFFIKAKKEKEFKFKIFHKQFLDIKVKYINDLYFWYFIDFEEDKNLEFYKTLIDDNLNLFLLIDNETGNITYANKAACEYYLYSYQEITNMNICEINTLSKDQIIQEMELANLEKRSYFKFKHKLANNEIRQVEVYSRPITINQNKLLFSIVYDINRLEKYNLIRNDLFLYSPLAESLLDIDGRILSVNYSFSKLFAYNFDEIENELISDLIIPDNLQSEYHNIYHQLLKGEIIKQKTVRQNKHKKLINVELLAIPCQVDNEVIGIQVIYNDISQEVLKEKEDKFILDNTNDLISKIEPDGTILYVNDAYAKSFGKTKETLIGANVVKTNKEFEIFDPNWIADLLKPPYTSTTTSKLLNGIHISWRNDAVLNENGEVAYLISVGHDVTEIKKQSEKLRIENITDPQTGLLNQRGLQESLEVIKQFHKVTALIININNYRSIKDYYGFEVSECLIKIFANELKKLAYDSCVISKKSSHEFVVIVYENYNTNIFEKITINITNLLKKEYFVDDFSFLLTANIGIAVYPEDTKEINKLISLADLAMIESKKHIYKTYNRYNQSLSDAFERKVRLAKKLKEAIENDKLDIFFQPIYDTKTNSINYIEALARWHDESQGYIPPNEFIPLAEEIGLMIKLDFYLVNKALTKFQLVKQYSKFNQCTLNLNVSPHTLLHDNFCNVLNGLIINYRLNPKEICLEISENTFINNIQTCIKQIHNIKNIGVSIALDDFGREYSSLSILDSMDFDIIKVDKLFIDKIDSIKNIEIIKMILNISKQSNKIVIAEGVETKEQSTKLLSLGCFLQQGYYFAKPEKHI